LEKLKEKNFAGKGDLQDFLLAKNGSMKMDWQTIIRIQTFGQIFNNQTTKPV
jgi:hypothetical protein